MTKPGQYDQPFYKDHTIGQTGLPKVFCRLPNWCKENLTGQIGQSHPGFKTKLASIF